MSHFKLFLTVAAGSLLIWIIVNKIVSSTDHLPDTFSVDTYNTSNVTADDQTTIVADTVAENATEEPRPEQEPVQADPASIEQENEAEIELRKLDDEEEDVSIELERVLDDVAEVEVIEVLEDDDASNEPVRVQINNSEPAERIRADSDTDMQDTNEAKNVKPNTKNTISKGKPLALDTTLLSSINPSETTKPRKAEPVQAFDIAYAVPPESDCVVPGDDYPRVGVLYRPTSFAIKGQSLTNIDKLVALHRKCGGKLLIFKNNIQSDESEQRLMQLRQDEVKYYLLQRRIPKDDMIFPDNS